MNNGTGNPIKFKPNLNQRRRNVGPTNNPHNSQQNSGIPHQLGRGNQQPNRPYFSDPLLLVRVSEYLKNLGRNAYINIDSMLLQFQREYPEYRRRQQRALKSHIIKAVDVVRFENSLAEEDDDSADDVIDDDSSDVGNVTENQSFTYALEGDGDVNSTLEDSYLQQNAKRSRKTSDKLDEQELIDIVSSSDEETKDKDESNHGSDKTKKTPSNSSKKKNSAENTNEEEVRTGKKRKVDVLEKSNKRFKSSLKPVQPNVSFKDIGGNEKVLNEVTKLLVHLLHPEVYRTLGVSPPRGFLLHGPPGSGKTLLANAIAGELKLPLLKVAAPELVGGLSGQSEERIRDLFEQAVALAPCILFIDEVDAITPNRENAHREMERRIVAQLLTSMDELSGSEQGDQVLVIGATNRPDSLDPALRRAGRFDREVCLGIPDRKSRQSILRTLCHTLRLTPDLSLDDVAALTPGYVGADLKSLVTEAAMASVRRLFKDLFQKENGELKNKEGKEIPKPKSEQQSQAETEQQEPKSSVEEDKKEEDEEIKVVDDVVVVVVVDDKVPSDKDEAMEVESSSGPAEKPKEEPRGDEEMEHFLNQSLLRSAPLSAEQLQGVFIMMDDFKAALTFVQPSAKREGFATVPDVKWEDIGSLQDIRQELQMSIMAPVKFPQEFARLGLQSPTGILLCGPPGCGKTLLAKAIANEAGINFISVKGPELLNMYVGESERAVRQCFQRARSSQPCVIFFDEIDALCPKRSGMENGASRVVNQLLTEMDGVEGRTGVYLMAATNRPDIVDPAVMRPGRLDKVLYVGLPNADDRGDILHAMTKNGTQPRLAADVDLRQVAEDPRCEGYTGADLGALVREASMEAMKEYMTMTADQQATSKLEACGRHFTSALASIRPSVSNKDKQRYENLRLQYAAPPHQVVQPPTVDVEAPPHEDAKTSTETPE